MRLRRALSVTVLATLAMGGLSACQTKVGMAASVNAHRISDTEVATYVKPGAKPYVPQGGTTQIVPKLYSLENWIDNVLFDDTVTAHGGPATASERSAAEAVVLGDRTVGDYQKFYGKLGYTDKFGQLVVDQSTTIVILEQRLNKLTPEQAIAALQQGAGQQIVATVNATKPAIDLSPRYGEWDPSSLSLSADPTAGLPSFVTVPGAGTSTGDEPAPAG